MSEKNDITILDGNLKDNYIVQKCEPLLLMRTVPFELGELKVLDTYISRINSHDDNCTSVTFTKTEYEQLMGLERTHPQTLKKYLRSLLQKVVDIPMPNGYMLFSLFTAAKCEKDEYEQWNITLACSEQAKELFFNIEQLGYLKYELKNVLSLTSKYSFLLYLYLRKERYRGEWVISLKELREQHLDIKNTETYLNFKYFNRDILDKAVNEVNEKTDINFVYETVKTGRRVTGIQFKLIKVIETEVNTNQLTFENVSNQEHVNEIDYGSELCNLIGDVACNNIFTKEQVRILTDYILKIIPQSNNLKRCDYMVNQMHKLDYYNSRKPIKDKFAYLKNMLEGEMKK